MANCSLAWDFKREPFCEGVISLGPEYASSISSVAMIIFGTFGLFLVRYNNLLLRVISASLAVTGFGSILYHWNLQHGWGLIDSIPMLISSYLGALMASDAVLYKLVRIDRKNMRLYEIVSGILALVVCAAMAFSLAMTVIEEYAWLFSIMFLIPELIIGLCVMLIRFVSHRDFEDVQYFGSANRYMYIGFSIAVLAGVVWSIVENVCKQEGMAWIRFLHAHSFWHVSISYGMYLLMQYLVFINAYNKGLGPYFRSSDSRAWKWFWIAIPAVAVRNEPGCPEPGCSSRSGSVDGVVVM